MKYKNIAHARFIEGRNRFVAYVELDGKVEKVHVKNTECASRKILIEVKGCTLEINGGG
jgi:sugar fermentation stimulation protein A